MTERGSLRLRRVGKQYPVKGQALEVLRDITLDVEAGSFISIVGASGCGKSTLLRLIIGLDADFDGQILLDGEAIHGTSLRRGIVFQDHRLLPWLTLWENIGLSLENVSWPHSRKRDAIRHHIELVGLTGFEQAFPYQLSGGMAQRAAIARGLVSEPEILLLDEPLGALDALTRIRLQDELLQIWQRRRVTMVLVTHDVEEAVYLGDRVLVMQPHPGRITREVALDLPRPRDRASPRFTELRQQILHDMGAFSALAA
nr:ABC transporter ATP-binding protein [uncultured Rhodopila sp.]